MADNIILETHIFSNPPSGHPPWSRSFHLRLAQTSKKANILALIRDSVTRLGRTDPINEAQVTLYWTQSGRAISLPGSNNTNGTTAVLPIYYPPQIMGVNINLPMIVHHNHHHQQMNPGWPLAMTYSGGFNYLHTYGPGPALISTSTMMPVTQQTLVVGRVQMGYVNVNIPAFNTGGGRPVISDVVREARLDGVLEENLAGMLEWATGVTGLKLIVVVDVDGRDVVSTTLPPDITSSPTPPAPPTQPEPVSSTSTAPAT